MTFEERIPLDEAQLIEALGTAHPCVYLPGRTARLSYLYPRNILPPEQLDRQLAKGQRRSGPYLYYMSCLACRACEPTRVIVPEFRWTRSITRVEKRGDRQIRCEFNHALCDDRRVELYNLHKSQRHLGDGDETTPTEYKEFLTDSRCDTRELAYYDQEKLIGCTVIDVGQVSMSAVYTFFDPAYSHWSIGTYAVLKLIRLAEQLKMMYVYLGLYVAENQHLRYKARFAVQERLVKGEWVRFQEASTDWVRSPSEQPPT